MKPDTVACGARGVAVLLITPTTDTNNRLANRSDFGKIKIVEELDLSFEFNIEMYLSSPNNTLNIQFLSRKEL